MSVTIEVPQPLLMEPSTKPMEASALHRITVDPAFCQGQPTIRGMRIIVGVVLKMLAGGATVGEGLKVYPELGEEDLRQAMRYAAWKASYQLRPTI